MLDSFKLHIYLLVCNRDFTFFFFCIRVAQFYMRIIDNKMLGLALRIPVNVLTLLLISFSGCKSIEYAAYNSFLSVVCSAHLYD